MSVVLDQIVNQKIAADFKMGQEIYSSGINSSTKRETPKISVKRYKGKQPNILAFEEFFNYIQSVMRPKGNSLMSELSNNSTSDIISALSRLPYHSFYFDMILESLDRYDKETLTVNIADLPEMVYDLVVEVYVAALRSIKKEFPETVIINGVKYSIKDNFAKRIRGKSRPKKKAEKKQSKSKENMK